MISISAVSIQKKRRCIILFYARVSVSMPVARNTWTCVSFFCSPSSFSLKRLCATEFNFIHEKSYFCHWFVDAIESEFFEFFFFVDFFIREPRMTMNSNVYCECALQLVGCNFEWPYYTKSDTMCVFEIWCECVFVNIIICVCANFNSETSSK